MCFLPFPSWQSLISLVTSATVLMYGFAPVTLAALRRSDPDRPRPYRIPAAPVIAPLSFIAANLIIYWTPFTAVWKLGVAVAAGYVIFSGCRLANRIRTGPGADSGLQLRSLVWILPWLLGLGVISGLGQYGGTKTIPDWWDLGVVAGFSIAIYLLALRVALPAGRVAEQIAAEQDELVSATSELGEPTTAP
jgi:amino acid transporter